MTGVRPRFVPPVPGFSSLPEMNVRTYVTLEKKPGVYFFSLDAGSRLAVWAARTLYHLRYFYADMSVTVTGDLVEYESRRVPGHAAFRGSYRPSADVVLRSPGSLDHWLTERYCLYTVHDGQAYRAEIHHPQWPLQDAEAKIEVNTMAAAANIALPADRPLLHFSRYQEVLVWPLKKVRAQ
jgi:uncharacterized protein YqjF (DUF2071 family)